MKILMIAQAFAPVGGSHATRVTNLVKSFVEMGHEVTVLTATSGKHKPDMDISLLHKVPAGVKVVRAFHGPMHEFMYRKPRSGVPSGASSTKGLKGLLCPDTYIEWLPFAVFELIKLLRNYTPDVIVSSASPYTSHLIGLVAKKLTKAPWVVDSGDPWVYEPSNRREGWRLFVEKKMETAVLKNCSWFTVTTTPTQDLYSITYRESVGKTSVVSMGFAPEDYPPSPAQPTEKFSFVHAGRLTAHRDASAFISAVADMRSELEDKAYFVFYGGIPAEMREHLQAAGIEHLFHDGGWVPNSSCMAALKNAGALILFGNNTVIQVPGKLFNYMGSQTPILYLQNHPSLYDSCLDIIGDYPCATAKADVESVKQAIREVMTMGRAKGATSLVHSWKAKAAQMDHIFRKLVERD